MLSQIKRYASRQTHIALALFLAVSAVIPFTYSRVAEAASPPLPDFTYGLLAAGERSAVLTLTTNNNTTTNNGSEWYYDTDSSIGFAPAGETVSLDSADISGIYNDDTAANDYRLSWHASSGNVTSGWRSGSNSGLGAEWGRYVFQASSLPGYYPSGPQRNVAATSLTGWTLCYSGTYAETVSLNTLFNTLCTGDYLLYASSNNLRNLINVKKNGQSVLYNLGDNHNDDIRLFVGDTLNFSLTLSDGETPTAWSHYRVYRSTCVVSSDCSPGNPIEDPENWDSGTVVTNSTYTIPESAELEQLYVYQADDSTGERLDLNAVRLYVTHTPVEHTISSCEQLENIDTEYGEYGYADNYELTNDIDCSGIENFEPLDFDNYAHFEGTFDGQGHTISNLTINHPDASYVGLFEGSIGATIKDVTLAGGSVTGDYVVGALAGESFNTTLTNVHSDLDVSTGEEGNNCAGGLIGYAEYYGEATTISNVSSTGDVFAHYGYAGGLFGELEIYGSDMQSVDVVLEKSFATGNVSSPSSYVGGLIGYVYVENEEDGNLPANLVLRNTYSRGAVTSEEDTSAGGLIGYAESYNDEYDATATIAIEKSYATGAISATTNAGGLIGTVDTLDYEGENIRIADSFATGAVTALAGTAYAIAGSEGYADEGGSFTLSNVYFDQTGTGQSSATYGGITGWTAVNTDGSQAAYFKNNSTNPPLNTWDFDTIWASHANDYPTFEAENLQEDTSGSASLTSAENGTKITIAQSGCTAISNTSTSKETSLTIQDPAYAYPVGFAGFNLTGCSTGGTATVTVTFTGSFNHSKMLVRKYNPTTHSFTTISQAAFSTTTLDGQLALQAVYTITDGGELDQDGAANGTIVDPVGLGTQAVGAPNTGLEAER